MPEVDEEDDVFEPLKIIGMKTFIFGDKESLLQYFEVEENYDDFSGAFKKNVVLKREIICPDSSLTSLGQDRYLFQMH